MAWLVRPSLIAGHQWSAGRVGGRDNNKVPGTDPSRWELIYSEFSSVFEKPGTLPERAIKHNIDLSDCSVAAATR